MTIKTIGRQLADHLAATAQPVDVRRECHCGRNGIGPHWHCLTEGCPPEPDTRELDEQPDDPIETEVEELRRKLNDARHRLVDHVAEHVVFGEREGALYVALRLTASDDRAWSSDEVLKFADYLIAGKELAESAAEPAVCGQEIESTKAGTNGQPTGATLRCVLPPGHSTPTPHRDGNGTSWTRTEKGQTT